MKFPMSSYTPASAGGGGDFEFLANYTAATDEATHTFTPSSTLTGLLYSEIIAIMYGQCEGQGDGRLSCELNAETGAKYDTHGFFILTTNQTIVDDVNANDWELFGVELSNSSTVSFSTEIHIPLNDGGINSVKVNPWAVTQTKHGFEVTSCFIHATTPKAQDFTQLLIQLSVVDWLAGTTISYYGIKRT